MVYLTILKFLITIILILTDYYLFILAFSLRFDMIILS